MNNTTKILETINQEIFQAKQYIDSLTAAKAALMGASSYVDSSTKEHTPELSHGFSSSPKKYTQPQLNAAISASLGKKVPNSMNYYYVTQLLKQKRIKRVSPGTYQATNT